MFFHAVGEKEDENGGEAAKTPKATDLLEPKEELLSADEEEEEEDEPDAEPSGDENEPEKEQQQQARASNESQQQNWQLAADVAATKAEAAAAAEELQRPGDAAEATSLNVAATGSHAANGHCKSRSSGAAAIAIATGKFDFNLHILLPFGKRYMRYEQLQHQKPVLQLPSTPYPSTPQQRNHAPQRDTHLAHGPCPARCRPRFKSKSSSWACPLRH